MSREEIRDSISGFCNALMRRDVEKVLAFFAEDATLVWGPFTFEARQGIKIWATGLGEIFPKLKLRTMSLRIWENRAIHAFIIEIILPKGNLGQLPCMSEYEIRQGIIRNVKFSPSHGYIIVESEN